MGRPNPPTLIGNGCLIGLRRERELNSRRINSRVKQMVHDGLVDEARKIWSDPRGVGEQGDPGRGLLRAVRPL